jgi:hypothetical protein
MNVSGKLRIGLAAGLCAGMIFSLKVFLQEPAGAIVAKAAVKEKFQVAAPGTRDDGTHDTGRAEKSGATSVTAPFHALAMARAEPDHELRETLLRSVLREWGATDPTAALQWVRTQDLIDFTQAITSVFQGAVARDPESAVHLAKIISGQDPEHARDYGASLVSALGNDGDFHRAAAFAAESEESARLDLLTLACAAWAGERPRDALDFAARLSPDLRRDAFNAIISRWATTDARSVAGYALTLDSNEDRTFALSAALRAWSAVDAGEAAEWVVRLPPSPELDMATAAVASHPEMLSNPAAALSLADSITHRPLRMRMLTMVLNRWATTDAVLARKYADTLADITPDERLSLHSAFSPDFDPVSFLP